MAGRFEREAVRLQGTLPRNSGTGLIQTVIGRLQEASEPSLMDGDLLEKEFVEVSRRAASTTAGFAPIDLPVSYALVKNSITEADALPWPQRLWARLIATGCLVDRNEPWKLWKATGPQHLG